MKSVLAGRFRKCYAGLPVSVQQTARKNYELWSVDPYHPSLNFKLVVPRLSMYSIRVGMGWRALATVDKTSATSVWIGSHAEYDAIIARS